MEHFKYHSPLVEWFLEAAEELGYEILDVNGEQQTGFTLSHGTLRRGLRCSTAKAFIRPVKDRDNLHVSLNSMAESVLIDSNTYQAYGVDMNKYGIKKTVRATKEVILSAGAVQSPQLLMVSGIGDCEHLKSVGVDCLVHSPGVGMNLQDHVSLGGATYLFDAPRDEGRLVFKTI